MFQRKISSVIPAICLAFGAWPASAQTIANFAGNGTAAFSGDGAAAVNAAVNDSKGMAIDAAGNVYIADSGNARVRKVNAAGMISTYAGNGVAGFSGDGGLAVNASLNQVMSVALDAAGNLYVADAENRRIRKIDPSGIITTIAGTGVQGYSGDGGPAASAMLGRPVALALDGAGNLYYVDSVDQCVRRINAAGIISTVAGNGVGAFSGDGGLAVSASLDFPLGIALDSAGNIYVADANNNRIRRFSPGGIITTVAGGANEGFSGDGGLAVNASINIPSDVAVDGAGNMYIADAGNNRVRMVDPAGVITTIAGIANNGFSGDGGSPTLAMLNHPWSVTVSSSGTLYLGDMANFRVREIVPAASGGNPPAISANGIVNGSSFAIGLAVAPGSLAAIFGTDFASSTTVAGTVPLPTILGKTSVTFNGIPAPLFFVSATQINAQVPFTIPPGTTTVEVTYAGKSSAVQTIDMGAFSPGIFVLDQVGTAAIFDAVTFATITGHSPAHAGEAVAIYATGLGPVLPAGVSGAAAPDAQTPTNTKPIVTIGGIPGKILYSGLAPTLVSIYQIDVTVPAGLSAGNQLVQIDIGGVLSNAVNMPVAP
jgi:uncharacterized protein (TIGR03437 family)